MYGASEGLATMRARRRRHRAVRPASRRGSRTTSGSRPGCPGPSSPSGRCCRPRSSEPTCASRPRPSPSDATDGFHSVRTERRLDDDGPRGGHRHRRAVPAPPRARRGSVRGHERLLRGDPGGGASLRRRAGRRGRWRQLGRSGRGVPRRPGVDGAAGRARVRPRHDHVPVPRRPAGADARRRDPPRQRGAAPRRRPRAPAGRGGEQPDRRTCVARRPGGVRLHRRRAAHPLARRRRSPSTSTASSSPGPSASPAVAPPRRLDTAGRCCSRRPVAGVFAVGDVRERFGEAGGVRRR